MTTSAEGGRVLVLDQVRLQFGALAAVNDVSLSVVGGARHGLIGPNGAGKSSLFSVIAGARRATSGSIKFRSADVSANSELERARLGLVRTFQHSRLFLKLSVLDNVAIAVEGRVGSPLRPWQGRAVQRRVRELSLAQLEVVGLQTRAGAAAGLLSHGERRQLEIALVLATNPSLIMFDEPTAGMSAAETQTFVEIVNGMSSEVTTIIVEHDLDVVFSLCDRVSVLSAGRLIADGPPAEIRSNDAVREAYLGQDRTEPLFWEA